MSITYKNIELDKLMSIDLSKLISKTDLSQFLGSLGDGWEYIKSNESCSNHSRFENVKADEFISLTPDVIFIKNHGLYDSFLDLVKSSGDVWNSGNEAFESFYKGVLDILEKYSFEGVEEVILWGPEHKASVCLVSKEDCLGPKYVFKIRANGVCLIFPGKSY